MGVVGGRRGGRWGEREVGERLGGPDVGRGGGKGKWSESGGALEGGGKMPRVGWGVGGAGGGPWWWFKGALGVGGSGGRWGGWERLGGVLVGGGVGGVG